MKHVFQVGPSEDQLEYHVQAVGPAASDYSRSAWVIGYKDFSFTTEDPPMPKWTIKFVPLIQHDVPFMMIQRLTEERGWVDLTQYARASSLDEALHSVAYAITLLSHQEVTYEVKPCS